MSAVKHGPTPVTFDDRKYGQPLAVDAGTFPGWTGIVPDGEPHVLDFHEFLLVSGGQAELIAGGRPLGVRGPAVVITTPGLNRRVAVRDPLAIELVVFSDRALNRSVWLPALKHAASAGVLTVDDSSLRTLQNVARLMAAELASPKPDSGMLLDALLAQFLIALGRSRGAAGAQPSALLSRFDRLIERHFREQHAVASYAGGLNVSVDHLSSVVREHFGVSAKTLIDRRVFAEAVRLVTGTSLPIADVGAAVGFDEPAHFTRFFVRMSGQSPRRFRAGL